jgi:hypothetical protein
MGIVCEKCRKLHLIAQLGRLRRIRYHNQRGEFQLTCPCSEITYFQKRMLKPYSVADYVLDVGYADSGEYREEVGIIPRQQ